MGDYIPHEDGEPELEGLVLGDRETVNQLQFIEQLHAIGVGSHVDLPQLVVVGEQNTGKSSVLQAITQLPFPVDDTLCTRFATEVSLRRSPGPESLTVQIKRPDSQEAEPLNDFEFTNPAFGSSDFKRQFKNMLEQASDQILGPQVNTQVLSQTTLHITVNTPTQINLTIVDLPGLVSSDHPLSVDARSLVNRYISNPRSTILAVAVPLDPDTQEVLQIIRDIPDRENRVIGVINKCDRRQDGADHWILDAIRNERQTTNRRFLSRGWYGLRNRLPSEANFTNEERDEAEAKFFRQGVWRDLNQPNKLGITNLKNALTRMHNNQLSKAIPALVPEIRTKLAECNSRREALGESRSTVREQRDCMMELASSFTRLSTDALDGIYYNIPENQAAKVRKNVQECLENFRSQMNDEFHYSFPPLQRDLLTSLRENTWRQSILGEETLTYINSVIEDNRGLEFADEVNSNATRVLWTTETANWHTKATKTIDSVVACIKESIDALIRCATVDEDLQRKTAEWLASQTVNASALAEGELSNLISDERRYLWTLQPVYDSTKSKMYNRYIAEMVDSLISLHPDRNTTRPQLETQVKLWLSNNRDVEKVLNTYVCITSYYEVAMTRFIDNVGMQVVERHLLGKNSPLRMFTPSYVLRMSESEPDVLRSIAGENEEKTAEREAIEQEIAKYQQALREAERFGYLRPSNN
ncbi:P-loop containing nucleoside triphosphate hydrolase protein [Cadophora sp. DSE1049]|nr:P-loop containing nucleoside triphosphate hydrolase protein [Cadophora sp. DSE1049]